MNECADVHVIAARINRQWESRAVKTDWLALERTLRDILANIPEQSRSSTDKLIADAIGAYTGRGTP